MLGHLGPPAKDATPALIEIIKTDKNVRARCEALIALGAIGADAAEAVPVATACLNDPHEKVCYSACYALGRIGPKAIGAKLELQKKLSEPDQFIALAAASWNGVRMLLGTSSLWRRPTRSSGGPKPARSTNPCA